MSRREAEHWDVAAYALSVLDQDDELEFERHLPDCPSCQHALAEFTPIADLLAEVDLEYLEAADESFQDGRVLERMLQTVERREVKTRTRRLGLVAAAVFLLVVTVSAFAAGAISGRPPVVSPELPNQTTTYPSPNPTGPPTASTPAPDPTPGAGPTSVGGASQDPAAPRVQSESGGAGTGPYVTIDPTTTVKASVRLLTAGSTTRIELSVSSIKGPMRCRMMVRTKTGDTVVASSWNLPDRDYDSNPYLVSTTSPVPRAAISSIQIWQDRSGAPDRLLVTVPIVG